MGHASHRVMLVKGSLQPWGSDLPPPLVMSNLWIEYVDLWQIHLFGKVGPLHWPLFLSRRKTVEIWENSASLAALHHTKTLDRGQQLLRNPNYWNCVNFAKIAAALQLTMSECKLLAIFPELLCDQRNGKGGERESFAKCGKNLKVDQATVGKRACIGFKLRLTDSLKPLGFQCLSFSSSRHVCPYTMSLSCAGQCPRNQW